MAHYPAGIALVQQRPGPGTTTRHSTPRAISPSIISIIASSAPLILE